MVLEWLDFVSLSEQSHTIVRKSHNIFYYTGSEQWHTPQPTIYYSYAHHSQPTPLTMDECFNNAKYLSNLWVFKGKIRLYLHRLYPVLDWRNKGRSTSWFLLCGNDTHPHLRCKNIIIEASRHVPYLNLNGLNSLEYNPRIFAIFYYRAFETLAICLLCENYELFF